MRLAPLVALLALTGCPTYTSDKTTPDDTATIPDSDTDTDSDTDSDTDADSDTDTDSDTDADTDTDTDTDTDVATCDDDLDNDGYTASGGDCRPDEQDAYPGAEEDCNGRDDDCDGQIDEDGACGSAMAGPPPPPPDTGAPDTGTAVDTALPTDSADSGTAVDTGPTDTGPGPDTAPPDSGPDTGPTDTGTSDPNDVDDDNDGYTENGGDCDDTNRRVNPRSPEQCNSIDDNCDGTVDEDCPVEVSLWWIADATVCDDTTFLQGHLGYEYIRDDGQPACSLLTDWTDAGGSVPADCPDCDWSFNLDSSSNVVGGPGCDAIGLEDGTWGEFTYSWGFSTHATYTYRTYSFELENVLWIYYDSGRSGEWQLFAFNYAGTYSVDGDDYYMTVNREITDSYGDPYYYYYYP